MVRPDDVGDPGGTWQIRRSCSSDTTIASTWSSMRSRIPGTVHQGGQRTVGQRVADQPSQTVTGDVGAQHPHFLDRALVLPSLVELQTAALTRAELGLGATALIVELRRGNACQLECAEQIGVLPQPVGTV
jgi:hypothetical protein